MAGITREERQLCWNVCIWAIDGYRSTCVAGVYQRDGMLRVADMAHELELCLTFQKPDDDATPLQPALFQRGVVGSYRLIVLDHQNELPFPTPTPGETRDYDYVFHRSQCTQDLHSLNDSCIYLAKSPTRRIDARYIEIGKQPQDNRLIIAPLRRIAKRRSESISSVSRTTSSSPAKTINTEEPIPRLIISLDQARSEIESFRSKVILRSTTCAISGKGKSWCASRMVGPGIKAAHIVPQFHGQKARLPSHPIDENALQYHWDMCCLENTPMSSVRFPLSVFDNVPTLPPPSLNKNVPQGDLSTGSFRATSDAQALRTQASPPTQTSDPDAHPHSPPPGEPALDGHETIKGPAGKQEWVLDHFKESRGSEEEECIATQPSNRRTIWRFGREIIEDPDIAQQLMNKGWLLETINNDEKYDRGRSREKRRCVASEEDAEDDGVHGRKRQSCHRIVLELAREEQTRVVLTGR
ncbi:hypothetical protein VM1G_08899 [Cytospora mali]|uniref:HNH nuclease domain-containing protein n=1 Tax=Cytospora mali TaxID=578113 RepID=A0A194WAM3_CYTMA|nr:hypothetical protein VM1G_08899 [Valsa mali]